MPVFSEVWWALQRLIMPSFGTMPVHLHLQWDDSHLQLWWVRRYLTILKLDPPVTGWGHGPNRTRPGSCWEESMSLQSVGLVLGLFTLAILSSLQAGAQSSAEPTVAVRMTIGAEEVEPVTFADGQGMESAALGDDLLLHRPMAVDWSPSGTAFVLCKGNGTVVAFDDQWRPLRRFGRQGEGPGEISNPRGILAFAEEVWVVEARRIERFGLQGSYLGTLVLQEGYENPIRCGQVILAIGESSPRLVVTIGSDGEVLESFGPECERSNPNTSYLKCGSFWKVLPAGEQRCLLIDTLFGEAVFVSAEGMIDRRISLDLGKPDIEERGYAVYVNRTTIASACALDSGCLILPIPKAEGDPIYVRRYAQDLASYVSIRVPDEIAGELKLSPRGELCIIDEWNSQLHVCDLPLRGTGLESGQIAPPRGKESP